MGKLLTTQEAADKLGIDRSRVLRLIGDGRLKAKKYGPQWIVDSSDLAAVKGRKPGRPKKTV
jgi:excisionase family DNA binding protein